MSAADDANELSREAPRAGSPSVDIEIAAERLLEDETLRGGLSDDGFAPLLEVALALILRRGDAFASTDSLADAARAFVRAVVQIAEFGVVCDLGALLEEPLFSSSERQLILGVDLSGSADADERSRRIADRIALACRLATA